ncbi:MAG: hypothetical protein J6Z79_03150 [Clostridia bacterium]|nr:hypothetical protein [Clostridia bacterium]
MSHNDNWGNDSFQRESDDFFAFTQVTKDANQYRGGGKGKGKSGLATFLIFLAIAYGIGGVVWLLTEGLSWVISLFR